MNLTMNDYLKEIEHAATVLIDEIWRDHARIEELGRQLRTLEQSVVSGYRRADAIAIEASDPEEVAEAAGAHWDTYFGPDKELHHGKLEMQQVKNLIALRKFSIDSLSGSLLQYAKQGISIAHKGPKKCPDGRKLTSQSLKAVVWSGRNQAIHWEEGKLDKNGVQCFTALAVDYDKKFSNYNTQNLAFDVVSLLGWRSIQFFMDDMRLLA